MAGKLGLRRRAVVSAGRRVRLSRGDGGPGPHQRAAPTQASHSSTPL